MTTSKTKKKVRVKISGKKKMTKKNNPYFTKMLDAKKKDLDYFRYGGNKYVKMIAPTGMVMYKKG